MVINNWRAFAWTIIGEPTVRVERMLRPIINRPSINLYRGTQRVIQKMPNIQMDSPDLFIGIAPWMRTLPEDDKRYEIKTNEDWEDKTFHVKIKEYKDDQGLLKKQGFVKYTIKWDDGVEKEIEKPFSVNYHNRVWVSQYFKDYNSKKNKYKPLKWKAPFLSIFSDKPDTLMDEMIFEEMYR